MVTVKPGYRPQSSDTSIEVDALLFSRLRLLTLGQKVERFVATNQAIRSLTLQAARNKRADYLRKRLGELWLPHLADPDGVAMILDPIAFTLKIAAILEPLDIKYFVGGSVASSLYGESRYSEDIDLIIEVHRSQLSLLIQAFSAGGAFYISQTAVEDAFSSPDPSRSFNILDNQTLEKADLFILKQTPFAQSKMQRRRLLEVSGGSIYVCSPEDIILQKLLWGKASQSEKQWRDVLGVLKVQGTNLDFTYLLQWSLQLGLEDDLGRAFVEAGL